MNSKFQTRLEKIESALNQFLPENSNDEWKNLSFGNIDSCVKDAHFANLIKPCKTLVSLGGKRWRPLLMVLCAELAADAKKRPSSEIAYALTPLVEFAHTASLIHDDIEDNADTRRGKPAAHLSYGLDVALNAASWLYFQATACIENLPLEGTEEENAKIKNTFYSLFTTELRRLHLGQAMDILWHRNADLIPNQEEYTAMVRNKTGTLARLAVKAGILAGGGTAQEADECGKIAEDIGTGFQILDDVTNLTTGNPGKKRGDDIVEGKKSLPVLLHLKDHKEDVQVICKYFAQAKKDGIESPAVEECIELLTKSGAIEKAKGYGVMIIHNKTSELADFFGNGECESATLINELFASMQTPKK